MAQTELKRQIGLFDGVMLISGDMIGTGIFISTGVIAETLPTPGGVLLVWLFGGLLALAGALTCAELSASLPYAGGDYNYIREAYGKLMGFLSGWSSFLVTFSGAIAFLAVIFNGFMSFFFPIWSTNMSFFRSPYRLSRSPSRRYTIFHRCAAPIGIALLGCPSRYVDAERPHGPQNWRAVGNHCIRDSLVKATRLTLSRCSTGAR